MHHDQLPGAQGLRSNSSDMSVDSKGRELFIVDNSVSGWTGLRYLGEWSGIAKAFDIATGYFDIGALLTLDGKWQGLDKIRNPDGRRDHLPDSQGHSRGGPDASARPARPEHRGGTSSRIPFCTGFPRSSPRSAPGRSSAASTTRTSSTPRPTSPTPGWRWWAPRRWWAQAISRCSGLTKNIELNVQIQSAREVAQLQEWFEDALERSELRSHEAVIKTICAPHAPALFAV